MSGAKVFVSALSAKISFCPFLLCLGHCLFLNQSLWSEQMQCADCFVFVSLALPEWHRLREYVCVCLGEMWGQQRGGMEGGPLRDNGAPRESEMDSWMAKLVTVYHTVFLTLKRSLVELDLAHACWERPFISVESSFFLSKTKWLVSWHLKLSPNLHCSIWWIFKSLIF